jgi:LysW-gamma-L-lysine carboxypeptidase
MMQGGLMDPIALLRRMVEIPSLSGAESPLAGFLVEAMTGLGFRAGIDEAGNAVGSLGDGPAVIVLLGHMDTVPGEIPVRIEGEKLFGRGSVDAKGALAAFIAAAARVGPLPGKRIVVIGATEEEAASSRGAHHAASVYRPACCVIGEPSGSHALTLGYRGRLVCAYEASAGSTHSASAGENVLESAVAFWNGVKAWTERVNGDKSRMFDRLDPALREIRSDSDGLTDSIRLKLSLRIPPGMEPEAVEREVASLAGAAGRLRCWGADPPYRAEKNSPLVRAFLRAIREAGGSPRFTVKSGTSDMNVVGPRWRCPILAYGPGDSALDHTPHEHLDLAEYRAAIDILARALRLL